MHPIHPLMTAQLLFLAIILPPLALFLRFAIDKDPDHETTGCSRLCEGYGGAIFLGAVILTLLGWLPGASTKS
jgi:uncharacterized membrane protein YqaE (UPF0057 family)